MNDESCYHKSVLVDEVLYYLDPKPNEIYVDATFGGGGHTSAILEKEPSCKVIAVDWDQKAIEINAPKFEEKFGDRIQFIWGNFSRIGHLLKKNNIKKVNGILADFGTSQYQIFHKAGFSFYQDSPLDMRMSPGHFRVTAYDIVNKSSEAELSKIFFDYGEERHSRKIARAIVNHRKEKGYIKTTLQLAKLIEGVVPRGNRRIHPATRVFQAIRIVVNNELNNIKALLSQSIDLLETDGRLVCISFHSLEDRIVKNFINNHPNELISLSKSVIIPTKEEILKNPSSRSSKLRAAKKIS